MASTDRPHRFNVRMGVGEMLRLRALAAHVGLSSSDVVRTLVAKAWNKLSVEQQAAAYAAAKESP